MNKFKIGDKANVDTIEWWYPKRPANPVVVIDVSLHADEYLVKDKLGCDWTVHKDRLHKTNDMKKEANLTLETAKKLYKEGGAARDFALDNYATNELVEPNWPKSWRSDDFCFLPQFLMNTDKYEDVRSMQAYWNLRRMAEQMNDGWEPDWENGGSKKWIVTLERGCLTVYVAWVNKHLISFKAEKMAEFSLKHHKELWEQYYQINP